MLLFCKNASVVSQNTKITLNLQHPSYRKHLIHFKWLMSEFHRNQIKILLKVCEYFVSRSLSTLHENIPTCCTERLLSASLACDQTCVVLRPAELEGAKSTRLAPGTKYCHDKMSFKFPLNAGNLSPKLFIFFLHGRRKINGQAK